MNRTLNNATNAQRILKLTADTMLLIDRKGICIDIDTHSELWFLQEEKLLGKNIFQLLPKYTREKICPVFQTVLEEQRRISKNFKLELENDTYYFKCIMYPYDDMVLCQYRDITRRSNVKHLLEQANRNLREIQKVAQIGQWTYNTRNSIFYYLGHTGILCAEDVKSISLIDYQKLIIEEDRSTFNQWCKRNIEGLDKESISYRILFNGDVYYVQVQTYLREQLSDGSLNIEGYIQNITDIQHRRNDINTLTHAINNAKESIFAAKKDGTLIFANRQFLQNHSIAETEDINQLKIYEIVADMNTQKEWQDRCKNIHTHGSSFIVHNPTRKNKNILAFEGIMYNVTNDAGEESYWSFSHDISERLRYEAQIKWLNRIMDTTIDNLPAGIIVKDINNDFRYIYRNRESYNRDLCNCYSIGKNDFDYYPQEVAEAKRKEDIEVATTGQGLHWTLEGKDKNGNLLILDKRKIRVDGDDMTSPIIISIEWDITAMELMKRELQSSKEKAELSDNLKSAFLANMSHEIRTPLNAIVGFSNLIAESEDREERKSYYDIVEANNERLLQLINEILDLSKIESGIVEFTFGPVNLHKLCKEVYDAHIFRTPLGVKLIYEPSNERLMISTDKNRVFQVFSNLIGNAFKFTKEGSISYGFEQKDNRILLHVTDTGTGIEPNKVNRVFERFAKLNNYAQGTGLGLSICKTIIERLNGEISVTSEIGKGTTFTFFLPYEVEKPSVESSTLSKEAALLSNEFQQSESSDSAIEKQASSSVSEVESVSPNKPTILIAEDTDSNYDLLNAILGKQYRLFRAHDGIEVVTMYEEVKPDLILMDIKMPNLDGLEATKIIRELSTTVPIIAQSAYAYGHDLKSAKAAGCDDFIAKPIAQVKLKEIIKQWLPQT
ncbi:PAS domain-containing hybrid sensor histidine kinase/response regulator [Bacteroides sp.]|uniref:PAS domain-containing hybrid sensor histidine kinase/response regulator n=1 Tax=Bacteroides sp. TaxID=29523 RepID=UPI002604212C|nr:PAS domain-containing hybrid sensor histidine kinase/response regulator [Bacteroides sp.]MDD3037767.1 ATP-binding protein [Bacteroides sp.]